MSVKLTAASNQSIYLPAPLVGIGDGAGTQFTGLTLMFWFKPNQLLNSSDGQMVFFTMRKSVDTSELLYIMLNLTASSGKIGVGSRHNTADNASIDTTTTSWAQDVWHHIAVTLAANSGKIYVDGALETTLGTFTMLDDEMPNNTAIGIERTNGTRALDARIAEFKIWKNRVLTLDQINIERFKGGISFYPADCKLYLPLKNKVLPATYTDFSQSGNTGTPQNTPAVDDHPPIFNGVIA